MSFSTVFALPTYWTSGVPMKGGSIGHNNSLADATIVIDRQFSYDQFVDTVGRYVGVDRYNSKLSFTLIWSDEHLEVYGKRYAYIIDDRSICFLYLYSFSFPELYVSIERTAMCSPIRSTYEFGGGSQYGHDESNRYTGVEATAVTVYDECDLRLGVGTSWLDLNQIERPMECALEQDGGHNAVTFNESHNRGYESSDGLEGIENGEEMELDSDSSSDPTFRISESDSDLEIYLPDDHFVYGDIGEEDATEVGGSHIGRWNKNPDNIGLGTLFRDKKEAQTAIAAWSSKRSVMYHTVESKPHTWCVECVTRKKNYPNELRHRVECAWKIRTNKQAGHGKWEVVLWTDKHNCVGAQTGNESQTITSAQIADLIISKVRSDTGYKVKFVQADVNRAFQVNVTYKKAWHGRRKAMEAVYGTWESNIEELPAFMEALKVNFCKTTR